MEAAGSKPYDPGKQSSGETNIMYAEITGRSVIRKAQRRSELFDTGEAGGNAGIYTNICDQRQSG